MNSIKKIYKTAISMSEGVTRIISNHPTTVLVFNSIIITALAAYVQREALEKSLFLTFEWVVGKSWLFTINVLLVLLIGSIFLLILKRLQFALLLQNILMLSLSLVNYFKLSFRGEPFLPWDLTISREALKIIGQLSFNESISLIIFLLYTVFIATILYKSKPLKIDRDFRFSLLVILIFVSCLIVPGYLFNQKNQVRLGVHDMVFNEKNNYLTNGLLNAFLLQVRYSIPQKPENYSKELAKDYLKDQSNKYETTSQKPNIIMVMDESFWDPTRLPNVVFSKDPLANFHQLQKTSIHGNLLTEQFGGNTANTEFEVLTGNSMQFLPFSSSPYLQYIKKPINSLPNLLKSQGYDTYAIHPYEGWYWNREKIYPLLGFDKFASVSSFSGKDMKGWYVSDRAATDYIVDMYNNREQEKPFYSFLVTMQNHPSYTPNRYDAVEISATSSSLSLKQIAALETYTEGVKDADLALKKLVDYFSKINTPTYIVFWGDHLPILGNDYSVYKETGYISGINLSDKDLTRLHSVPFLIWSNNSNTETNLGTINDTFLAPILLKKAGIESTNYFTFLEGQMKYYDACNSFGCIKNGKAIDRTEEVVKRALDKYSIVQYYHLFDN